MDIRQLEAFVYTVKTKSFSEAAKRLYLSQPTISAHIHALEQELQTQLIRRTTKTLSVTPAGMRLYDYATSILTLQQKAVAELSDHNKSGLHIGASSVPSLYSLPELLSAYHKETPDIHFHTYCSDSLDVIRKVNDNTFDIGFVGTTCDDTSCKFLPYASDELVIATPATPHFKAYKEHPDTLKQLLCEPFLIREDNSGTRQETLNFLKSMGISMDDLHIIAIMNDPDALKQCIFLGLGISILSRAAVEADAAQEKLLVFPLGDSAFLRRLYVVYSPDRYMPEKTRNLLHFIKKYYDISLA